MEKELVVVSGSAKRFAASIDCGTPPLSEHRYPHMVMFLLCTTPFLLGSVMEADAESATLAGVHGPACPSLLVLPATGCPGCGLTRAVVLGIHGEWETSWAVHPAGMLVLALCLGGMLVHGDVLRRGRRPEIHRRLLGLGHLLFVSGVLAAWVYRLATTL